MDNNDNLHRQKEILSLTGPKIAEHFGNGSISLGDPVFGLNREQARSGEAIDGKRQPAKQENDSKGIKDKTASMTVGQDDLRLHKEMILDLTGPRRAGNESTSEDGSKVLGSYERHLAIIPGSSPHQTARKLTPLIEELEDRMADHLDDLAHHKEMIVSITAKRSCNNITADDGCDENDSESGSMGLTDLGRSSSGVAALKMPSLRASAARTFLTPGPQWIRGIGGGGQSERGSVTIGYSEASVRKLQMEPNPPNENPEELVTASPVTPSDENNVFATAKPVSWVRSNQLWLTGVGIMVLLAIVLSIVFTMSNRYSKEAPLAPTTAPTTLLVGIRDSVIGLLGFDVDERTLFNESTPQSQALSWLSDKLLEESSGVFDDLKIVQQYALATFFFSTGGESTWNITIGWLADTNECNWFGVSCDEINSSVVSKLSLTNNGLKGRVPPDLSVLADGLSTLDLSSNALYGEIPSEIGLLTLLNVLSFASNAMRRGIPSQIGLLTTLEYLDLSGNQLRLGIPDQLTLLTRLNSLNVSNNELSGSLPHIGAWTSMRVFDCSSNSLTLTLPEEFGLMTALEEVLFQNNAFFGDKLPSLRPAGNIRVVDGSNNFLFGSIPTDIGLLEKLEEFTMTSNLLTGTIPGNIADSSVLTSLGLGGNLLSGEIPSSLLLLRPNLRVLDLSRNFLNGGFTKQNVFGQMKELETFDISFNTNLNGTISDVWTAFTNLVSFRADQTRLQLTITSKIGLLSNLEVFSVSGNDAEGSLPTEIGNLRRLRVLDVSQTALSGTIPPDIGKLTTLAFFGISSPTISGAIPTEVGRCTSLIELNLDFYPFPSSLPSELGLAVQLKRLSIFNSTITGSIPTEIGLLSNLIKFDAAYSEFLTGRVPSQFGRLTRLAQLNLPHTNVSGWLPTEIGMLERLLSLDLGFTRLSGSIPSEVGRLTRLSLLDLSFTLINGTIPSQIGRMQELTSFDLKLTSVAGSIPSEVGKLTRLSNLVLSNLMNGTLPTVIGRLEQLQVFVMDSMLSGSVPTQVGLLGRLENLIIGGPNLNGTVPSQVGNLEALGVLELTNAAGISGSLPSEIGGMEMLQRLNLSNTGISGAIPSQLGLLTRLITISLEGTSLTGSIPSALCALPRLKILRVGCGIGCSCCQETCAPTMAPSKSVPPSSGSFPTFAPSTSMSPSLGAACERFRSIANIGMVLPISNQDDGVVLLSLPFIFPWREADRQTEIVVTSNGVIWVGNSTFDNSCCVAFPVELGGQYIAPRIAVGQADLNPASAGTVYAAAVNDSFVVSWEGVPHSGGTLENELYFQAALYADGMVELRWGQGKPLGSIAAGVEDDQAGVAVPASGDPFGVGGVTVPGLWPTNQCRTFSAIDSDYVERGG